jgi:hypothetical protein
MFVRLQLPLNGRKIHHRMLLWRRTRFGKQKFLQDPVVTIGRQRPTHSRFFKPFQIPEHTGLANVATACDLRLIQLQLIAQAQRLFYLAHGHPFLGHSVSSTWSVEKLTPLVGQRRLLNEIPLRTQFRSCE